MANPLAYHDTATNTAVTGFITLIVYFKVTNHIEMFHKSSIMANK
jgi:hypothetical protein